MSIGLKGEELTQDGLDFLQRTREGLREPPGRRVVVIGGGNVAVDVAISARGLGAEQVTIGLPREPGRDACFGLGIETGLEEGVGIVTSWGPQRVLTSQGKVCGLELIRCTSVFDKEGRFAPTFDPGKTTEVDADTILLAVGRRANTRFLPPDVELKQGWISIDESTGRTSARGVYAGGDAVRPANVIDAIAAGKRAAAEIHADLTGEVFEQSKSEDRFLTFDPRCLALDHAMEVPRKPAEARAIDQEDTHSLPFSSFEAEARRCLNCGCVAVSPSDTGTALVALDAVIQTTGRAIPASEFFACRERSSSVLETGELVTEVRIPRAKSGIRSAYRKSRRRQSIDFPLVSAAARLDVEDGRVQEARVVLGAAAPLPLRAKAAEEYLKDKDVEEVKAPIGQPKGAAVQALPGGRAAELALKHAVPLLENGYKIQMTRAYVRRSVLACLGQLVR